MLNYAGRAPNRSWRACGLPKLKYRLRTAAETSTNPGQAEQVVDAEPQTDRIHRKQRLGAHTCNMYTAPDTWHLAVFKAFRSELLTSPYPDTSTHQ